MNRENDVSAVLQQYSAETGVHSVQKVEQDFVAIAQHVPAGDLTGGLAQAIHSEQTPPFDELMRDSYMRGGATQRAAMLKRLLDGASAEVLRPLVNDNVFPHVDVARQSLAAVHVDESIAGQLAPETFQQVARLAVEEDPAVIDRMIEFYAIDPDAGRTLGGAALSVAMGKVADNR
ncbi:MAG TPA: hypothetical protein VGE12_12890 [Noviherbaspirillum sp.]